MKMKKSLLFSGIRPWLRFYKLKIIIMAMLMFIVMSFKLLLLPDPPPPGKTGSIFDGADCTECHSDYGINSGPGTVSIVSDIPESGYVPGSTYTITASITQNGKSEFQFELSPHSLTGAKLGTLIQNSSTQIQTDGPRQYISGSGSSLSNPNSNTWSFQWVAPAANTGDVTFYSAFLVGNSDFDPGSDYVYKTSLTVSEAAGLPLSSNITASADVNCNGSCDGSATVTAVDGSSPYTYLWSNGQSTETATGLCAGSYSVTVTDASSATSVSSATITEPAALTLSVSQTPDSGASNGTATAVPSGGTSPYTYLWSNAQTSATATGLAAGSVSVTITDANGCTGSGSVTVIAYGTLYGSVTSANSTCYGVCDGSASVTAFDGTPPYSYLWSTGDTTSAISGLCDSTYTVTITDSNTATFTVSAIITQPAALVTTITSTPDSGFGNGTATASVTGGSAPYTYLWNNGQSAATATGLSAGTVTVTITDANGCTKTDSTDILLGISAMSFQASLKIYPNPSNGNFSLEITSMMTGSYTVTVMDDKGQRIYREKLLLSSGQNIYPVDLGSVRKGIYIIQVLSDESVIHIPVTLIR